jgi:hypothetical protein
MKIKNLIKDNGNWGKLKNPLMIFIVAIVIFYWYRRKRLIQN